jgi:hypothetical protein
MDFAMSSSQKPYVTAPYGGARPSGTRARGVHSNVIRSAEKRRPSRDGSRRRKMPKLRKAHFEPFHGTFPYIMSRRRHRKLAGGSAHRLAPEMAEKARNSLFSERIPTDRTIPRHHSLFSSEF